MAQVSVVKGDGEAVVYFTLDNRSAITIIPKQKKNDNLSTMDEPKKAWRFVYSILDILYTNRTL